MNWHWFGHKHVGWGISPSSWHGWLATGLWLLGSIALATLIPRDYGSYKAGAMALWLLLFLGVMVLTYRHERE